MSEAAPSTDSLGWSDDQLQAVREHYQADPTRVIGYLASDFVHSSRAATIGNLAMGKVLQLQRELGISDKDFRDEVRANGGTPPSASRCTVYRTAYQFWIQKHGIDINLLRNVSIDALYHSARLVEYQGANPATGQPFDALSALTFATNTSDKDLRAAVKAARAGTSEAAESGLKNLTVQSDAVEALKQFSERLTRVVGAPHEISPSAALLFVLEQVNTLPDDSLDYLWRESHGEVSEEEAAQVQTVVLDLEPKDEQDEVEYEYEQDEWENE